MVQQRCEQVEQFEIVRIIRPLDAVRSGTAVAQNVHARSSKGPLVPAPNNHRPALLHVGVALVVGSFVGAALLLLGHAQLALVGGWVATGTAWCALVWFSVRRMDGDATKDHSQVEDSGRAASGFGLLTASVASLAGVGQLLVAGSQEGSSGIVEDLLGLAAVFTSWFTVHLVWSLRYARLYYGEGDRGIDFPQDDSPDYRDFVYLAYCLGMTYQVSDTDLTTKVVRRAVTRHTLLSYLFGAVVVACSINLVVQLTS